MGEGLKSGDPVRHSKLTLPASERVDREFGPPYARILTRGAEAHRAEQKRCELLANRRALPKPPWYARRPGVKIFGFDAGRGYSMKIESDDDTPVYVPIDAASRNLLNLKPGSVVAVKASPEALFRQLREAGVSCVSCSKRLVCSIGNHPAKKFLCNRWGAK